MNLWIRRAALLSVILQKLIQQRSISIGDKATNFFSPFGVALGAGTVVGAEGAVALGADSTAYIAKGVVG